MVGPLVGERSIGETFVFVLAPDEEPSEPQPATIPAVKTIPATNTERKSRTALIIRSPGIAVNVKRSGGEPRSGLSGHMWVAQACAASPDHGTASEAIPATPLS